MMVRKALVLTSIFVLISMSCKQNLTDSFLKDVYRIDIGKDGKGTVRRHEAGLQEINWTIRAPGCSGILLNPSLVLTASHCKLAAGATLSSGFAVATRSEPDIVVESVVEQNRSLDYSIVSVKWTRPMPSQQTFPPWIAIEPEQVFASQLKDQGDLLFSVGFPDDKARQWSGTYSQGQAKTIEGSRMTFNIGLINGNSGGAVLKKDNLMLVAIAIGGNKRFGEAGWDQADADNPKDWNFGTTTWAIYNTSKALQKAFPNGRNEFLKDSNLPRTSLYLSVEDKNSLVRVSGNIETDSVLLCAPGTYPCNKESPGVIKMEYEGHKSGRRFYTQTLSEQALSGKAELAVGLVALDKNGTKIGSRHIRLQRMRP